jgi:glycosyltransferase involved in cell wall biosynthesis
MKIAYLSLEFPPRVYGGLGVYVNEISKEMAALGQSISVFTPGDGSLPRQEQTNGVDVFRTNPVAIRDGLEIFLSPETLAWGEGLRFFEDLISINLQSAAAVMDNGPFDICVAHDWLGLWGGMAVKREGLPLIYHVHGLEVGRSDNPNQQLVALERRGAELADRIITVSEAMKRQIVDMGISKDKISVCYHGVDGKFFDPQKADQDVLASLRRRYGFAEDDTIILFLGRLEPVKGVKELLAAFPSVLSLHPKARLLLVGRGSLEAWVKQELQRLGDSHVSLVTDFLSLPEKMHHYALADICVFPSIYEPFGIVALEAAAMGRAAVVGASGTSGLAEIVRNPATSKPTGVHVDPRRADDIAWGINLALEDRDRLLSWGKNARELALNEFTWQKAAQKTLAFYRDAA